MDFFKKNLKIKTFCLLGSIILWVYVMYSNPEINRSNLPATMNRIINQEELDKLQLVPSVDFDPKVSCSIRGKRSYVTELMDKGIFIKGTIIDPREGENVMQLVGDFPGVVISINPPELDVRLERKISKTVPVEAKIMGDLLSGYSVHTLLPSSSRIDVQGPESQVQQVKAVWAPVDAKKMLGESTEDAEFIPVDENGQKVIGVNPAVSRGHVKVSVLKEKEVPIVLSFTNSHQKEMNLSAYKADPAKILIKGPAQKIDEIDKIFTAKVSVVQYAANPQLSVGLAIPKGMTGAVEAVKVYVDEGNLVTKNITYPKDRILFTGFSNEELEKLRTSLPDEVNLSVRISKELLQEATADNFMISVGKISYNLQEKTYPWSIKADFPFEVLSTNPGFLKAENG